MIVGEYEGNYKSGRAIIFSHGFGMKRDSRGFFTEIGNELTNNFLIVRFDYCKMIPEDNATLTYSLSVQARMLQKVIEYVRLKFMIDELNIIAHSMGCLVVGMAKINKLNKVALLCAPPSKKIQKMQSYFNHKQGSEFNLNGFSKVKRSDGSWTYIHPDFWVDLQKVEPPKLFEKLSENCEAYFIRALQDDVIKNESYTKIKQLQSIKYIELLGDHNFKEPNRKKLLATIVKIFN